MICPNCQNVCGERDHFCCRCGSPLQEAVPAKKGALWVPVLILILLSAVGIAVFFCTAMPIHPRMLRGSLFKMACSILMRAVTLAAGS